MSYICPFCSEPLITRMGTVYWCEKDNIAKYPHNSLWRWNGEKYTDDQIKRLGTLKSFL